jgi:lysophospholipase
MGGAVTTAYLQRFNNDKISKAFLSSPMLEIKSPKVPKFVIGLILWIASTLAPKNKLFYVKRHPNFKPFESSSYTSLARYNNYETFRQNSKYYRTCTATNKWGYSAFKCTKYLNTPKNISKISVPIFIATAELDTLVNNSVHSEFASSLQNTKNKVYIGAKHEIFNSTNNVFSEYLQDLLAYFR